MINEEKAVQDFFEIIDTKVLRKIIDEFYLKSSYIHGIPHWSRVFYYGHTLSKNSNFDKEIIAYFSLFHDSKRFNDHEDPEHGLRGAEFFRSLDKIIYVSAEQKEIIYEACKVHNYLKQSDNLEVGMCLDSDRLDLWRVGIKPSNDYLHIDLSKTEKMKNTSLYYVQNNPNYTILSDRIIRSVYDIEQEKPYNNSILSKIKNQFKFKF